MADASDIVLRVVLEGEDDALSALKELGRAAEEAGRRLADSFGPVGKSLAIGGAITAAAAGLGVLIERSEDAAVSVGHLADQLGESVESVSGLESAIVSMGGSLTGLDAAFRRLATVAARTWDEIKRQSVDARDKQIADAIAVGDANEALFKAQQKYHQQLYELGRGPAPVAQPVFVQQQHAAAEAQREYEKAQLAAREAQKKADQDRLNDVNNIAAAVQKVVKGEEDVATAAKSANLETHKIVEGLVVGATPGALEGLQGFTGNLNDLANLSPRVLDLFKSIADFMKNSGDATRNAALATQLFGRSLGADLLPVLRQGSAELERNIEQAKKYGFELKPEEIVKAEEFHRAFNSLTGDLKSVIEEFARAFGPTLTSIFQTIDEALKTNNQTFKIWADNIATLLKNTKREINDFTNALNSARDKATSLANEIRGFFGLSPAPTAPQRKEDVKEGAEEGSEAGVKKGFQTSPGLGTGGLKDATTHNAEVTTANTTAIDKNTAMLGQHAGAQAAHTNKFIDATENIGAKLKLGGVKEETGGPKFVAAPVPPSLTLADIRRALTGSVGGFQVSPEPGGPTVGGAVANIPSPEWDKAASNLNDAASNLKAATTLEAKAFGLPTPIAGVTPAGNVAPGTTPLSAPVTQPVSPEVVKGLLNILGAGAGTAIGGLTPIPGGAAAGWTAGTLIAKQIGDAAAPQIADAIAKGIRPEMEAQSGMPGMQLSSSQQQALDQAAQGTISAGDQLRSALSGLVSAIVSASQSIAKASPAAMQHGGEIIGGIPGHDSVPILAQPNEFIMREAATRHYGMTFMHDINQMRLGRYQGGGAVLAINPFGGALQMPLVVPSVAHDVSQTIVGQPPQLGQLNLNFGSGMNFPVYSTPQVAKDISTIAISRAVRSGGQMPSWYTGN